MGCPRALPQMLLTSGHPRDFDTGLQPSCPQSPWLSIGLNLSPGFRFPLRAATLGAHQAVWGFCAPELEAMPPQGSQAGGSGVWEDGGWGCGPSGKVGSTVP